MLYDTFARLETLGVCRRGYFIEGMGGAQFALPGAVERLRAPSRPREQPGPRGSGPGGARDRRRRPGPALRRGAALAASAAAGERRPARVAGAYVVSVGREPVLYVERGGRGLITLPGAAAATPRPPAAAGGRPCAGALRRWPRRCERDAWASSLHDGARRARLAGLLASRHACRALALDADRRRAARIFVASQGHAASCWSSDD